MKRLIYILALVIVTMSLAGCVIVEDYHHRWYGPDAVIITGPPHYDYYYGPPHRGWHHHRW